MDEKYNFCTNCGSKVEQEDLYCKVCGTKRRELIDFPETSDYICSGCGDSLQSNDKYCCHCGFRSGIPKKIIKVEESNYIKPEDETNFSNRPVIIFVLISLFLYSFGIYSIYDYILSSQGQDFFNIIKNKLSLIINVGSQFLPFIVAFFFFFIVISFFFSWLILKILAKIGQLFTIIVEIFGFLILILLGAAFAVTGGEVSIFGMKSSILGIIFSVIGLIILLGVAFGLKFFLRAGKFIEFSSQLVLDEKAILIAPIILGLFSLISGLFMLVSYWEIIQLFKPFLQNQGPNIVSLIALIVAIVFEYFFLIVYLGISYILNGMVISYASDWYRDLDPDIQSARKDIRAVLPIIFEFAFAMATIKTITFLFRRIIYEQTVEETNESMSSRRGGKDLNRDNLFYVLIGVILVSFLEAIWLFLNFFTLISIIQKRKNLTDSIEDSANTMWNGLLDVIIGETGFNLTMTMILVLYVFSWFGTGFAIGYFALGNDVTIGIIIGLIFLILSLFPYNIISMPLNTSFKTFLFCYAQDSMEGFEKPSKLPVDLQDGFKYLQSHYTTRKMQDPTKM